MSVDAIRLQNFAAFEDTDWLELRPITLLFGRNSSGKSAIIRGLALLKQSLESTKESGPIVFLSRTGTDQGSMADIIHRKEGEQEETIRSRQVVFHFRCNLEGKSILRELKEQIRRNWNKRDLTRPKVDQLTWLDVSIGFVTNGNHKKPIPSRLGIELPLSKNQKKNEKKETIFVLERLEPAIAREYGEGWIFWTDLLPVANENWPMLLLEESGRGFWPVLSTGQLPRTHPAQRDWRLLQDLSSELRLAVETFLQSVEYSGPIRPEPKRAYALDGLTALDWKQRGLDALLSYLKGDVNEAQTRELDRWLQQLGLGLQVKIRKAGEISDRDTLSQLIVEESAGLDVNFKDVGFGASQVLPVLIQGLFAKPGAIVIIEQPELHLHPEAQATLADFFVDCSRRNSTRFLLETHSEHLLLRFQRRIAETTLERIRQEKPDMLRHEGHTLEPEELGVVFIWREQGESYVDIMQTDSRGQIINPSRMFQDFFIQDYDDVKNLNVAIAGIVSERIRNGANN